VKGAYRGLKKAWIGLRIAKQAGDNDKMKYYAEGIQKFEKQLNRPVSGLSDLLMGKSYQMQALIKKRDQHKASQPIIDNLPGRRIGDEAMKQ
jgi:hypothetical protein